MSREDSDENPEQAPKDKWYNHKPSKLTIAISTLVIYVFFVVIDAHDIWPSWPLVSVALGTVATIAVLYAEAFATEAINFRLFLIGSGVVVVGGIAAYLFVPRNIPAITPHLGDNARIYEGGPGIPFSDTEVRGILKAANAPTPPNGCGNTDPDALKVIIGNNAITHDGMGQFTAIGIKDCEAVSMERRSDGIFVDASLYDPDGQAVVSIRDNKIAALNGETYVARQSPDESRLVIRNARGTELFYIRYLNPTTVQFRGFLGCEGGQIVRVQDGQPIPGFFMSDSCLSGGRVGIQIGTP